MKAQGLNVLIELLSDREQDLIRRLCHNDHIASRAQHIRQIQHQRKHSQTRQPRNIRICHIYIDSPLNHQRPRQRRRQCDQNQDRDECNCPFIVQKIPEHPDQRILLRHFFLQFILSRRIYCHAPTSFSSSVSSCCSHCTHHVS